MKLKVFSRTLLLLGIEEYSSCSESVSCSLVQAQCLKLPSSAVLEGCKEAAFELPVMCLTVKCH